MSRTYRKYPQYYYKCNGEFYYEQDMTRDEYRQFCRVVPYAYFGEDFTCKNGYDHKMWHKPTKEFKVMKRRVERARVRQAIHRMAHDPDGNVVVPNFPNSDVWDWT